MKKLLIAVVLAIPSLSLAAGPYVQLIGRPGSPLYITEVAAFTTDRLAYDKTFTDIAIAYHPLSAGSAFDWLQRKLGFSDTVRALIPSESWACTVGGSYLPASPGDTSGSFGCGLNLLDTARGWASSLLKLSSSDSMNALADQIAPSPKGPATLFVQRQWDNDLQRPLKFGPRWGFGAGYAF